ncbi:radical SAM family heme chaperone HemW [Sediminibacterium soli]|uniref:radical SAM family heme chaperone HemW n=1 Tax=Sediminibacterium soli TaxID=2698829 RepID=UPI00137AD7B1|nr:radical SAM family heme chaperone HemW [Sediminibacterium soli]NCI45423.1 radical SAM family heme chaperone HemW [Sediminibacterium soli]
MAGIYLHIPFCKKACHYCNFHFSTSTGQMQQMVDAICREASLRSDYLAEPVDTVYFGGGTPSLLTDTALTRILASLHARFAVTGHAEVTLETNPDDISPAALQQWKEAGINRLSIGVQSFFEEDLRWMNRAHDAAQALQSIELAQTHGFTNITVDLIYGSPGLTDEKWEKNLAQVLRLGIPHVSCYALTVEPRTALAHMIETHTAEDIDPDKQARQFQLLTRRLGAAGFEQYEISNFARPGFRSRHNSSYWQGKPYLGLGPSAHSFDGVSRQWNIANNALYLQAIEKNTAPFEKEILTPAQQFNEYVMTALRTAEGISQQKIGSHWGDEVLNRFRVAAEKHLRAGHIVLQKGHYVLAPEGKFLADGIAADLFRDDQ